MNSQPQVAVHYVNDGTLINHVKDYFSKTASHFGKGAISQRQKMPPVSMWNSAQGLHRKWRK